MGKNPVAIVVPTIQEFGGYRAALPSMRRLEGVGPWEAYEAEVGARHLLLIISDIGPANAAAATERMIASANPAAVLHGGSAGAHDRALLPGDIVVGARYVEHVGRAAQASRVAAGLGPKRVRFRRDGETVRLEHVEADPTLLTLAVRLPEREAATMGPWPAPGWPDAVPPRPARVVVGTVASADVWTTDLEEIVALHEDYGAACEDMESVYVAQICALHRVPFLAVRVISNNEAARRLTPHEIDPAIAAAGERAARVLLAVAGAM